MNKLKMSHYSRLFHSGFLFTLLLFLLIITGCGKETASPTADISSSDQKEKSSSLSSSALAMPIESSDEKKDDGIITFDDFKGFWATFDSKESEPIQSDIGKYTVAITDDLFVPGEWGTTLGASEIQNYMIKGSTLTLKLYTPNSNLESTDETYQLKLELVKKDGLYILKSINSTVIFYPVTSQEYLNAGWKIPSDIL